MGDTNYNTDTSVLGRKCELAVLFYILLTCGNCTSLLAIPIPSPMQQFTISQNSTNTIRPNIPGSLKRKGEIIFEDQPKRFFQGKTNVFSSETTQLSDINMWEKSWLSQM
ncbi:PREDICTED: protein FAM122A-like [Myotis brandtii]|uniref:protein FAM122A-like n=1 Tax=Myotis brandtii TaxID=109478 RepID=UPI0007041174|nr:PREDICTED: protein FAM122A-like [Myotis brandtii]